MRISVAIVAILILLFSCKTKQLAVVKLDGKFGCIDRKGKFVIEPTWDYCLPGHKNKQILVQKDSLYSYIDRKGNQIIKQQYKEAMIFYEGLAFVGDGNKYGFINVKGDTIVPFIYDYVFFGFSNGLSDVKKNDSCGYIDKKGRLAIPCIYSMCYPFGLEFAEVTTFDGASMLVNREGETFPYSPAKLQKKTLEPFEPDILSIEAKTGQGRVNEKGDTLIPPIYRYTDKFIEKRSIVTVSDIKSGNLLSGVYDNKGNLIVEPKFEFLRRFSEGLANFRMNNKSGYIDRKGKITIAPTFDDAGQFSNGLAWVQIDKKVGYINRKGKLVITPRFQKNSSKSSQFK